MSKVKCICVNCGWYQWLEEDSVEDCEKCGFYINSKEDREEE